MDNIQEDLNTNSLNALALNEGESFDEYLWRIGRAKERGQLVFTWGQLANVLREADDPHVYDESWYRKKYRKLKKFILRDAGTALAEIDIHETIKNEAEDLERRRVRIRDERAAYNRKIAQNARTTDMLQQLEQAIRKVQPFEQRERQPQKLQDKGMYIMLSDLHYGIAFSSYSGSYNPEIARSRVLKYADSICNIAERTGATIAHVSLMGDLISGNIHQSIRIENRENIISQIVQTSELIAQFLYILSKTFDKIEVDSVSGNHSRVESNLQNSLRIERLDALIPWYCKTKLSNISHIIFKDNDYDSTFAVTEFFGKTFVSVHGDMDLNQEASVTRISTLIGKKIDYFLSGHMHIAQMRTDNTCFIRNGAVLTGGDEYTSKKRLFGPAVQVALLVSESAGLQALYPIVLS